MNTFYALSKRISAIAVLALALLPSSEVAAQVLLDPMTQPRFVNQLTIPPYLNMTAGGTATIRVTQFNQDLGLVDPVTGQPMSTTVWGYNGTYPGPTLITRSNTPVSVYWLNNLTRSNRKPLPHLLPIDTTIHWALQDVPNGLSRYGVPLVTHLHGGKTESASDGHPEAWYTPNFSLKGMEFIKGDRMPYYYSNAQPAATNWYHDHTIGLTRLNVYAGLAGGYLIRDAIEVAQIAANQLPSGAYEMPLIIQDRMFEENGKLFYPSMDPMIGISPTVMPEFFGDFILVNGKTWPVLEVEPRPYRFRVINGADSRFFNLSFKGQLGFTQIGADMGFLPGPISLSELLIAPGERADIIIDFSAANLNGRTLVLYNNAKIPYPNGTPVDPQTTGQVMAFRVVKPLNTTVPMATLPASLRPANTPYVQNGTTRRLLLYEGTDAMGRLMPMLGTVDGGAMMWMDPVTETPLYGSTELWEVYNTTPDAHPVHLHGTAFQVVNRQRFTATQNMATGALSNINLSNQTSGPLPGERGWKDTAPSYPGEVLRVLAKFELPGKYVWHCHILSHEDNEMMRPIFVGDGIPGMRNDVTHTTGASPESLTLFQNVPNPFSDHTVIDYQVPSTGYVTLKVFDMTGKLVETLVDEVRESGTYSTMVKSDAWEGGMYLYVLTTNGETISRRMVHN